jgi:hypothetical protein
MAISPIVLQPINELHPIVTLLADTDTGQNSQAKQCSTAAAAAAAVEEYKVIALGQSR